jgi:methylmalonyl-CoA carboxyltransferase 5S subunit
MTKKIEITDVILRDAHQSLMATRMAMEDMIPALADLDQAGYWSLECWGGATFDSCIRFLNEDPWERLRTFKRHLPRTRLQMLLRGQNLLGYRHYADDVVDRFVDRAAANGMDVFRVFDALNDVRNLTRAIAAVKRTGKHAQGCICYTVSPVHTVAQFADTCRHLQDLGVDSICIKDMAALIKPQPAFDLVRAIKQACGAAMPVHLHVHATTGVTMVSLMKAVEAGADIVDTSLSSMSLGTGHNPTEAFCEMLEGMPYTHGLDLARVEAASRHFATVKDKYAEHLTQFSGVKTDIFQSQIPGGMLSNMESQLREQGAGDKLEAVLREVPVVRKVCGYPPLVTPSSQIVGTQAVFNVLMGSYKKLTGEFADLMLGYYGDCPAPRDPAVVAIAREQAGKEPINCRPADLIGNEWDALVKQTAGSEGADGSDEDVLTMALFPQVAPRFFKERKQGPRSAAARSATPPERTPPPRPGPAARPNLGPRTYSITVNGQTYEVQVQTGEGGGPQITSAVPAIPAPAPMTTAKTAAKRSSSGGGGQMTITADLAGTILRLEKHPGDAVEVDETILVLEAMKMETEVSAPRAGRLKSFAVKVGDTVQVGDVLAYLA